MVCGSKPRTLEVAASSSWKDGAAIASEIGTAAVVDWFDWIESDTWPALWFKDFFDELGYKSVANIKFYWLVPGLDFPNGLRVIALGSDTNAMVSATQKVKNLVVYVDHTDAMNIVDWDDVVANPVNDLPKVLSPRKVVYVDSNPAEKLPVFYTDLKKGRVDQARSSKENDEPIEYEEQDFFDSDYEISDGDEDLLEDVVDMTVPTVKGKNKKANGSQLKALEIRVPTAVDDDADIEDDGLDLLESDGEGEERL
ncbi:hypothetical protein QOZ80_3BG0275340 [Eleusine coracana subsp. coracana]|nr:hypothetical protein QOZ80_3BG0275340 [Eleusine coracana subsp. coracana]